MTKLSGKQRRWLRGRANPRSALVHVGEGGLSEAVVAATAAALCDHELVKIRLHEPEDKKTVAAQLAKATDAELCGLVGHTVILYRRNPEKPQLEVPGLT